LLLGLAESRRNPQTGFVRGGTQIVEEIATSGRRGTRIQQNRSKPRALVRKIEKKVKQWFLERDFSA
jgi:hypothetical protein